MFKTERVLSNEEMVQLAMQAIGILVSQFYSLCAWSDLFLSQYFIMGTHLNKSRDPQRHKNMRWEVNKDIDHHGYWQILMKLDEFQENTQTYQFLEQG